jgi:hypothetical protein
MSKPLKTKRDCGLRQINLDGLAPSHEFFWERFSDMRNILILLATTSLAACGGAGVETAGGVATGSGTGAGSSTPASPHTFVNPTDPKTYSAIGGVHTFQYKTSNDPDAPGPGTQYSQVYAGNMSTARDSAVTITYNPRDAIFDVTIKDTKALSDNTLRFQDPVHRTAFGGLREPQGGVPDLTSSGVQYLQFGGQTGARIYTPGQTVFPVGAAGSTSDVGTFFYQKPGTVTKYVTFAGFVRNTTNVVLVEPDAAPSYIEQRHKLERGVFVFGERTLNSEVPKTGSASYSGPMVASLVYNPMFDEVANAPTYFQSMSGNATTSVNFGSGTFNVGLTGQVTAPLIDVYTTGVYSLPGGSTFNATGSGRIDLVQAGGFLGQFASAYFTRPDGVKLDVNIAGSSVDGTFYGTNAAEVGGGFRIVGGVPDQRIDLLGVFTGKQ